MNQGKPKRRNGKLVLEWGSALQGPMYVRGRVLKNQVSPDDSTADLKTRKEREDQEHRKLSNKVGEALLIFCLK
jgi:hypothetical protein